MSAHSHITLAQLQQQIKAALDDRFALPLWVSAEISEIKLNRQSGHCYLELVEKGGDNGVPTAQARAVIWRTAYARIAGYFEAETGQQLASGLKILARVGVTYHPVYGFSLQINDIDPAYTLGDMEQQRLQTIARLQQEGVWDMNRELPMPMPVQRIAVVSSGNAAGYQDFCKELDKSPYAFTIRLFEAFMQGAAAEESIIGALCSVGDAQEQFDAVVIIRGGGSASDLNCFNAYRLCNYITQFPFPVVTGIGHDKDTSVADMVAHTALKTPTAVAGWLVDRMATLDGWLGGAAQQLHDSVQLLSRQAEVYLERLSGALKLRASEQLSRSRQKLVMLGETLPTAAENVIARQRTRLDTASELAESRSPKRILRMGFAIVRRNGHAVTSTQELHPGEQLDIEVSDGTITTEIK